MLASKNDELRRKILSLLYDKAVQNPNSCGVQRQEVINSLSVTENLADLNVLYLHEKKFLKICLQTIYRFVVVQM